MLSATCDISEFIQKMKGRSHQDIILLADQEATSAERHIVKHRHADRHHEKPDACKDLPAEPQVRTYALVLKELILYMRHGILTRNVRNLHLILPDCFSKEN